jgi:hypothetical protein
VEEIKDRKIPYQLIAIFILVSTLIIIAGYIYYNGQKQHIKREKLEELSAIADLKTRQIVNWRRERIADAEAIYANPFMVQSVKQWLERDVQHDLRKEILQWMASLKKLYKYHSILLIDARGTIRLSIPKESAKIGKHAQELFSEAISTRKVIFSDLHTAKHIKDIHFDFVIPLLAQNENDASPLGVFLIQLDPHEFLYPLIQTWPIESNSGETLLIRRERDEVVFLNELRHRKDTALTLRYPRSEKHMPAVMAVQGIKGEVEGIDYRGVPVLAAILNIPDTP